MSIEDAKANVGSGVIRRTGILQHGIITSVNNTYVFVRYEGNNHSKATNPSELEFLS